METKRANGNLTEIALKAAATRRLNFQRELVAIANTVLNPTPAPAPAPTVAAATSKAALLAECLRMIASL